MAQRSGDLGPSVRGDAILARWPGRCSHCAGPIRRGDLIVKNGGRWLHDDCDKAAVEREEEAA